MKLKRTGIALSVIATAIMLFSFTSGKKNTEQVGASNAVTKVQSINNPDDDPATESWARVMWNALKAASRELDHVLMMASTYSVVDEATIIRSNRVKQVLMSKL
jgi:hypothetical protein